MRGPLKWSFKYHLTTSEWSMKRQHCC